MFIALRKELWKQKFRRGLSGRDNDDGIRNIILIIIIMIITHLSETKPVFILLLFIIIISVFKTNGLSQYYKIIMILSKRDDAQIVISISVHVTRRILYDYNNISALTSTYMVLLPPSVNIFINTGQNPIFNEFIV